MIIKVRKYLFVGAKQELDTFYARAQQAGLMEFISSKGRKRIEYPDKIYNLIKAIKILKKEPEQLPGQPVENCDETVKETLDLTTTVEEDFERERHYRSEIARIEPLGDFSLKAIEELQISTSRQMHFYCMKSSRAQQIKLPETLIPITTAYDMDYFLSLEKEAVILPNLIQMPIEKSLSELKNLLAATQKEIQLAEERRKELTSALPALKEALIQALDGYHLQKAKGDAANYLAGEIFSAEAYIPKNKINEVEKLTEDLALHMEEIEIAKGESVPTYMENEGVNRVGEDLVHIYDTPSTQDKDPSGWVYWAFVFFFAMIVSDGGYGMLYLALGLFLKWKFPKIKNTGRRFIHLIIALGTGCVIWGTLTASFFGINLLPENPLRKYSLTENLSQKKADYHLAQKDDVYEQWTAAIPATQNATNGKEFLLFGTTVKDGVKTDTISETFNLNLLMEFSLLVGVLHIILSLCRSIKSHYANIGWITFMIGGYLFLPSMLNATTMINFLGLLSKPLATAIGLNLVYVGLGFALVTALIQKGLSGIGEVANLIQFFSDVLSYLRLYALGLAGMLMASTFNALGASVGMPFGLFIIIAGHSVNIVLGIMGGVIHGLRLNFLEWYHWSFEGGGKLFKPLSRGTK
ncbi:MAG: V-type ATPase 116kDa subunit family protein [Candidatus Algichlamydia australiensis]|nr:V-type ATPase 116kDa subunit family protein [Chlamydiales bacterium]